MRRILLVALLFISSQNIFAQNAQNAKSSEQNQDLGKKASLAGKMDGTITKDEIISSKTLKLSDDIKSMYHIISYRLTIECAGAPQTFDNEANGDLTQVMINAIKDAAPGCKINIEKIRVAKATNKADTRRTVASLSYVLK